MQAKEVNTLETALKEVGISFDREDKSFPLSAVGGAKVKVETLLYNVNKIINTNDIAHVDYTKGGTKGHVLEPLNNLFSDNIVIGCYIPQKSIEESNALTNFVKKCKDKETALEIAKEDDENTQLEENVKENAHTALINKCSKFLAENTEKVKRVLTTAGLDIDKTDIKPTQPKVVNGRLAQLVKVSLCECSYDKVILFLNADPSLRLLETEDMFIHDVDFTRV
jgi:hypothetical protein